MRDNNNFVISKKWRANQRSPQWPETRIAGASREGTNEEKTNSNYRTSQELEWQLSGPTKARRKQEGMAESLNEVVA